MNLCRQQFFALLRAGLWNSSIDTSLFPGETDWNSILTLAMQQTVPIVLSKGIEQLPKEYQPNDAIIRHLHALSVSNIRQHALMNRTLVKIVTLLRNNGIQPILLKGQGVASNYIDPTCRWCGDIDLYIGDNDYAKACTLARQWETGNGYITEQSKHINFQFNGVTVELHRIAEKLPTSWLNNRFQQWTLKHLQGDSTLLREIKVDGMQIPLPPVNFDSFYIFNHLWYHFSAGSGIGLRQLCDWARYLHVFHKEINRDELERDLRSFGLMHAWQSFAYIIVDVLGLPAEEYPFYTNCYTTQSMKILRIIEAGGNFGFFDPIRTKRPDGLVKGKLHSLREKQSRFRIVLTIAPKQIMTIWTVFLYYGIKQFIIEVKKLNK